MAAKQIGAGVLGLIAGFSGFFAAILRSIFLQKYEEQHHFLLSVLMGAFIALTMAAVMAIVKRFFYKNE
ncbi:MAG: hypothetical protein WC770_03025 [Phycisphaerae bacterium]|jgi:ABC-type uncharacterized transport system permease subunit